MATKVYAYKILLFKIFHCILGKRSCMKRSCFTKRTEQRKLINYLKNVLLDCIIYKGNVLSFVCSLVPECLGSPSAQLSGQTYPPPSFRGQLQEGERGCLGICDCVPSPPPSCSSLPPPYRICSECYLLTGAKRLNQTILKIPNFHLKSPFFDFLCGIGQGSRKIG